MLRDVPSNHAAQAGGGKEAMRMVIEVALVVMRLISAIVGLVTRVIQLAIRVAELREEVPDRPRPGE